MKAPKRNNPEGSNRRGATIGRDPDPIPGDLPEEIRLPSRNPTPVRPLGDPDPQRKKRVDSESDGTDDDDDDASGEMASAGQDVGLVVEERKGSSVEDRGTEDEEADWIDHDDATDKGRG